ncbi:hypothetical protein ACHAW5_003394 [Stephanodiscus triporus]|uniref:Uncharacterized protein n=1 Tax=Stephanodiscus triporus TaxID=2934178 RepID=A0ABD3NPP0_9STRA
MELCFSLRPPKNFKLKKKGVVFCVPRSIGSILAADSDLWSPGVLVLVDSTVEKKTEKDCMVLLNITPSEDPTAPDIEEDGEAGGQRAHFFLCTHSFNIMGRAAASYPVSRVCLFRTITWILILLTSSFVSFYVGVWTGIGIRSSGSGEGPGGKDGTVSSPQNLAELHRKAEELAKQIVASQLDDLCKKVSPASPKEEPHTSPNNGGGSPLFSDSLSHFVQGLARVSGAT